MGKNTLRFARPLAWVASHLECHTLASGLLVGADEQLLDKPGAPAVESRCQPEEKRSDVAAGVA